MATYTNLDDEIFAQSALEGYTATLAPLAKFSIDWAPSPIPPGNTVLVPLVGALSATTFNGTYATTNGNMSAITVTINRHRFIGVGQSDLDRAGSSVAQLERFGRQQGAALAIAVFQDITTSLWNTTNFGLATAVSVVDFGLAQIRAARRLLNTGKAPLMDRNVILDVDPFDNLLGITTFLQVNTAGTSESLREGKVGRALGFDVFETNGLALTLSAMGFFGHASAIAIAMRYLKPQEGNTYSIVDMLSDPSTGAVMGIREFYDNNRGELYRILESNYGYTVGISQGGRILKRLD